MITVDTKEKNPTIIAAADFRLDLEYDGPNGEHFSSDIEVVTAGGQTLRFERKSTSDCIQSFKEEKLDAQVSAADGLIVEWDPVEAYLSGGGRGVLARSVWRHLQRMALFAPVIITENVEDTVGFLRRLESMEDIGKFRGNRIETEREGTLAKLIRALPGVTPDRRVGDTTLLDAVAESFDAGDLFRAIDLDSWPSWPGIGEGTVQKIREAFDE